MKVKRFIAVAMVATMVFGNCVTAFAEGDTPSSTGSRSAEGTGVVEYDDSKAVEYDSVTVPTLTSSKYNFEIDPTGLLHEYDADTYVEGTVYFNSISTHASLVPNATKLGTDKLYEAKKTVYAVDSNSKKWKGVVKTASTDSTTGVISVTALNDGFYVWTPVATASSAYKSGKGGEFTALAVGNFAKWFDVSGNDTDGYELSLKNNYKSGDDICDGNIYTTTYTAIADGGIVEAAGSAVKVSDYATITKSGDTTTIKYTNVYTRSGDGNTTPYTYALLADNSDKMDYTPEKSTANASTDSVDITNKSTRDKKVTAVITMENATGLKFKATNSYGDNEADTSVYFAAVGGDAPVAMAIAEGETVPTATYEVTVPKKVGGDDVTYQTADKNAAGGHVYARYEGANPTYTTKAFYITASANSKEEAKNAWKSWAATLTSTTRPNINITYTVENVYTADEQAAMDAEAAATEAGTFKTTHGPILAKTTETVAASDIDAVNAALADYAELSAAAKALVATEKALLDDLKTAAEAKAITDEAATLQYVNSAKAWYVGDTTSAGLSDATFTISSITMKKDNGEAVDVSSIAEVAAFSNTYWIAVDYEAGADLGITYSAGSTYTVVAVVGNTRYTASKTY